MTTALDARLEQMGSGAVAWKRAVRCCITEEHSLSGLSSEDGVTLVAGDRVLYTYGARWGIYKAADGAWTRSVDLLESRYAHLGMHVYVLEGSANQGLWTCTSPTTGTIRLGITSTTWLRLPLSMTPGTLELPLVVATFQRITITAEDLSEDGYLNLPFAASGHSAEGTLEILIPASVACLGVRFGSDANTGDHAAFDAAADMLIRINCITASPNRFESTMVNLGTPDTTAPTLTSATVDAGDPDKLVLVFSEAVWLPEDAEGISITGDDPAVTISSVGTGNGTSTITLDLSRDIVEDEEGLLSIVFASSPAQDMNGNALANDTEVIAFANFGYTMPGEIFSYSGATTTYNGSDVVTAVTNGTPAATNFGALTVTGTISKVTTAGEFGWRLGAGEYFTVDAGAQVDMSSGSLLVICQTANVAAAYEWLCSLGRHGALTTAEISMYHYGSTNLSAGRPVNAGTGEVVGSGIGTALHALLYVWDPSDRAIYKDDVSIDSDPTDVVDVDVRRLAIGHDCNTLNGSQGTLDIYCVKGSTTKLAGAQITAAFDWAQATYGTP